MFYQKFIVSGAVLAFLDNLRHRAPPLFKISESAPYTIPNFIELTFKFLKKFL